MKTFVSLIAGGLALGLNAAPAGAQTSHDDEIRAAMVLNFARFAEWPASRFPGSGAPIVLCVDSADRIAGALGGLEGQDVSGRSLKVRQGLVQSFGSDCHVAMLAPESQSEGEVSRLHRSGVLTIGDDNDFSDLGAIELVQVGRQVRFEINNTAARAADVRLSSRLLRLAVSVK